MARRWQGRLFEVAKLGRGAGSFLSRPTPPCRPLPPPLSLPPTYIPLLPAFCLSPNLFLAFDIWFSHCCSPLFAQRHLLQSLVLSLRWSNRSRGTSLLSSPVSSVSERAADDDETRSLHSPLLITPPLALSEHAFNFKADDFKSHCCSLCSRSGLVTGCDLGVDVTGRMGGNDGAGKGRKLESVSAS